MKIYSFHSAYLMDRFIRKHDCEDWLYWNGEAWEPYYPEVNDGGVQGGARPVPVAFDGGTGSEAPASV